MIIFRLWYFFGIAAFVCAVMGAKELKLAMAAASEPEAISMYELEQGKRPSQPYVVIDDYYAVYDATAYETKQYRVQKALLPMLSNKHPWCAAWDELRTKYDDLGKVPNGEMPKLEGIKVMGLTKAFEKVGDIPDEGRWEKGTVGIFFNHDELHSGERELVEMIETGRASNVVVIELGRKPKSVTFGVVVLLIGAALAVIAVMKFRQKRATTDEFDDNDEA